jgi:hypothetical protein
MAGVGGGLGQRQVARDGAEVVEAQLDADGAPAVALALQVGGHLLAQLREDGRQRGRSATACRSRSKVVSRLIDTGSLCVTTGRSSTPCAASCSQRP